jgi:putative ATPase
VAQQYLPDALQGKLFYQPSDQGHEAGIQEQVARRREAQLTAMLEAAGSTAPPEVLTFTPARGVRDRWLERTISGTGARLARLRDRVMEAAAPQRHHLLLDLNAGFGLLTWEAVRRTPEGGVWALATEPPAGEALRQRARRLPEVERPIVLIGDPLELPELLALRGDSEILFDAVIGRNVLARRPDKEELLEMTSALLRPGGVLSLAEVVPRHSQRLTQLVDLSSLGADLTGRVRAAEEAIYTDPADPMVNWDVDDVAAVCETAEIEVARAESHQETTERRITPHELDRWFEPEGTQGRASYAEHLLKAISPAELAQVRELYEGHLREQVVPWVSVTLYLAARRPQ